MARHSVGGLATKLFGVGGGFLYAIAVARLLGPQGYGVLAVAISTATIIATVSLLGANELAVRVVAASSARRNWKELDGFVTWSSRTVAATSIIAALIMVAASLLASPYANAFLYGSIVVPLVALVQLMRGLIQGTGRVVAAQLPSEVVRWVITLGLIGLLVHASCSVSASTIILIVVIALAVSLVVSAVIWASYLRGLPRSVTTRTESHWFLQSLPFLAIALFGIIGTEIATLLLGWLSGPREAGLYQPIARLAPLMMIANQAIETALAPRIVASWESNDRAVLQRRMSRSAVASAVTTAVIGGVIVLASPYILRAFGSEFTKYQNLIIWVAGAQVVNAATGAAPLLLAMTNDMKRRIAAQFATMAVQAGLGIALIPTFGAAGAVAALVTGILVWSLLHWWLAIRATGIDTSFVGVLAWRRRAA